MIQKNRNFLFFFLETFFTSPSQNFKLHLFDEKGNQSKEFFADGTDANTNTVQSILHPDKIKQWARSKKVVSFTPNIFKPNCTTTEINLLYFNALFVDIDDINAKPDFTNLLYPPHFIFFRKEVKKYHAYWLIRPLKFSEKNREKYLSVQRYLTNVLGGDITAAKTPVKLMRLPYTAHSKEEKKSFYEILQSNPEQSRYSLSEIFETVGHLALSDASNLSGNDTIEILEKIIQDYKRVDQGTGRSRFIYWLSLLCWDWAIEIETAVEWVFKINVERCYPPETKKHCEDQIDLAFKYNKTDFGNKIENYQSNKDHAGRKKFLNNEKLNVQIRIFLSNWVYISQAEMFINTDTGLEFTTNRQLNSYLMPKFGCLDPYTRILQNSLILSVDKITIDAEKKDKFFEKKGFLYYNLFRPFSLPHLNLSKTSDEKEIAKNRKSIAFFVKHLRYLAGDHKERGVLLDYISYLLQNPGKKLTFAMVLITRRQGIGKSMLSVLFKNIMGEFAGNVENDVINDKYTDFLKDKLLVFIHELKQSDKFATTNKLKTFITEPETSIVAKYARTYSYPNVTNFIMFSNSINCLAIDENDRRFYIIYNNKEVKHEKYYEKLYKILNADYKAIYQYLINRNLKKFNPYKRPASTQAKKSMIELSKNEIDIHLRSLYEKKNAPFDQDLIILESAVVTISQHVSELKKGLSQKAVRRFLVDNGYDEKIRSIKIMGKYKSIRCWCYDWTIIENKKIMDKNYERDLVEKILQPDQIQVKYEKNDFKEKIV